MKRLILAALTLALFAMPAKAQPPSFQSTTGVYRVSGGYRFTAWVSPNTIKGNQDFFGVMLVFDSTGKLQYSVPMTQFPSGSWTATSNLYQEPGEWLVVCQMWYHVPHAPDIAEGILETFTIPDS